MTIRVCTNGKYVEINDSMDFYVGRGGRCGSGYYVFGEKAKLYKVLEKHLVFKTESGSLVKTKKETMETVGKAAKERYWVGIGDRTGQKNYYHERVKFYNERKCCFEYK